jgi:SAM-dependent methyltransferase
MSAMRQRLLRFYWRAQARIVPGLRNSQYRYHEVLQSLLTPASRWLDIGCGHQLFPSWMRGVDERALVRAAGSVVGMDPDWASLAANHTLNDRVLGGIEQAPFRAASFDLITANMVVEHLEQPETAMREIHRLLQPGGLFVFHTPNYQHVLVFAASWVPQRLKNRIVEFLEGRKEADIFPTYYRLNTLTAIKHCAPGAGFEIRGLHLVSSSAETVMLGPVVIAELMLIRAFENPRLASFRSNIVAVLRKPHASPPPRP